MLESRASHEDVMSRLKCRAAEGAEGGRFAEAMVSGERGIQLARACVKLNNGGVSGSGSCVGMIWRARGVVDRAEYFRFTGAGLRRGVSGHGFGREEVGDVLWNNDSLVIPDLFGKFSRATSWRGRDRIVVVYKRGRQSN